MVNKAVFIDRDGTLIFDYGYISDPDKVDLLPDVETALNILFKKNYYLFLITNQSGVGRGMMSLNDVEKVNRSFLSKFKKNYFKEVLICPHAPQDDCMCRKPKIYLAELVAKKYNLDLKASYSVGDKESDKDLGFNFGGYGIKLGENGILNILDAATFISKRN